MTSPLNMNGTLVGLASQAVQHLGSIVNNLGVIGQNTSKSAGHVPVVATTNEGDYMTFCHQCSLDAQSFIHPCAVDSDRAAVFPPQMLRAFTAGGESDPLLAGRDRALQIARHGYMDTPSGSPESQRLQAIIEALAGSPN